MKYVVIHHTLAPGKQLNPSFLSFFHSVALKKFPRIHKKCFTSTLVQPADWPHLDIAVVVACVAAVA